MESDDPLGLAEGFSPNDRGRNVRRRPIAGGAFPCSRRVTRLVSTPQIVGVGARATQPYRSRVRVAPQVGGWVLRFQAVLATVMSIPNPYAIVLDDHPLVGRGMAQYLQSVCPELGVRTATSWNDMLLLVQVHGCPRLLVADVWLAEGNSLPLLAQWHAAHPGIPWLATSADDDPATSRRVRAAGAQGFVHKQSTPDTFGRAIVTVRDGGQWYEPAGTPGTKGPAKREWQVTPGELGLTHRQGDILALLLKGMSNKRIALTLDITESTVKEHVTAILDRLGVRTRVEAIMALQGRQVVASGVA